MDLVDLIFTPSPDVDDMVREYADTAVEIAADKFGLALAFDEASISSVEAMATTFHARPAPNGEAVSMVARSLGSYVVEVFRRRNGGDWGAFKLGTEALIGFRFNAAQPIFWPWHLAFGRLTSAPDLDFRLLYRALGRDHMVRDVPESIQVGNPPIEIAVAPPDLVPTDLLCSGCYETVAIADAFVVPTLDDAGCYTTVYRCERCAPAILAAVRTHVASSTSAYNTVELLLLLLRHGASAASLSAFASERTPTDAALAVVDAIGDRRVRLLP